MCTLAAVFVGEGSHDLQSADGGFTCCTGGAAKRLTPPPQIITAFSHHWPIHGYGERRRTKSPGWHLTSNSFKAVQGTWRHFAADCYLKWPQQWGRCSFTAYRSVKHTGTSLFHVCSHFFLILSLWNIFALVSNINKEIRYFLLCLDVWKLPFDPYGCWNMNHKKSFQPEFPALSFLFSRLHMWFYSHKQICYFLWYQSVSCIWKCKLKC